jgi:protein O-mannosyl-transferase
MTRRAKRENRLERGDRPGGAPDVGGLAAAPAVVEGVGRAGWLFAVLLVIAVFLAYQPAWNGGFVWDDDLHLVNNPVLKPGGLVEAWRPGGYVNYWPMTFSVYRLEYELWGLNPLGFHLVNIALHALSALLVWRVLVNLRIPGAMFAAAVFALHPVNVESVAWIAQLKNVLCLPLGLLTMLFFLRHESNSGWWRLALSLGLFFLSTLAKGMMLTLPVVMLACAWWQRGRVDRRDLLRVLPFFVVAAAMAGVEVFMQHSGSGDAAIRSDSIFARAAVAGCGVWFYLGKVLWPVDLMVFYPRWNIDGRDVASYLPGLLLVGILAAAWWQRRTWGRPVVMLVICYAALLLPILGFVNIIFMQYSLVADHWQYAAMIVPCAALAGAVTTLGRRLRLPRPAGCALSLGLLAILGVLTFFQSGTFKDVETLYRTAIDRNPHCWLAQNNLGSLLLDRGHPEHAITYYENAIRSKRDYVDAYGNLGNALARLGRTEEAIPQYEEALRLDPKCFAAYSNLAITLAKEGQVREAIEHYQSALEINPNDVNTLNNLAWQRATCARPELRNGAEAVKLAERARGLVDADSPDALMILDTLAAAYAEAERFPEAVKTESEAIELAKKHKLDAYVMQLETRRQLYESKTPYRQESRFAPRRPSKDRR